MYVCILTLDLLQLELLTQAHPARVLRLGLHTARLERGRLVRTGCPLVNIPRTEVTAEMARLGAQIAEVTISAEIAVEIAEISEVAVEIAWLGLKLGLDAIPCARLGLG